MFWFKQCPRCSGDLYASRDPYGFFVTCIQCGFTKDVVGNFEDSLETPLTPAALSAGLQPDGAKRRRISHGGRHSSNTFASGKDLAGWKP